MMKGQSDEFAIAVVVCVVLGLGLVLGAINGGLVIVTRVPDIVVTLAMSFVWAGFALLVRNAPGGGAAKWLKDLATGSARQRVGAQGVRRPGRRSSPSSGSRSGDRGSACRIYAIGSNRLAAFRSGVSVGRTKIVAYVLTGPVLGPRRPVADREHGHRDAGAGPVHAAERRRDRPRRRQPRRRSRRRRSGRSSRS